MNGSSLLALCLLVCTGPVLGCDWDVSSYHGLTPLVLPPVSVKSCLDACCSQPDCDLVLVGFPLNGRPPCQQVDCSKDRDLCDIKPSTLFNVYHKKGPRQAGRLAAEGGDELPGAPGTGTGTKKTNNSSVLPDESTAAPPMDLAITSDNGLKEGLVKSEPSATESTLHQNTDLPPNEFAERCGAELQVGPCRAAFQRWYYNSKTGTCEQFFYGGCKGNQNNYHSKEACMTTCTVSVLPSSRKEADSPEYKGSILPDESTAAPPMDFAITSDNGLKEGLVKSEPSATESTLHQNTDLPPNEFTERCGAELQVGPCRAAFQRWYYNSKTGTCEQFLYGGCKGNQNNYHSKEACMTTCTVSVLPSSRKEADSPEYKDNCMVTSDPGPCRAAFPMFYYDQNTGSCQSFIYGGCHGNQNRYSSVEECMSRCSRGGSVDTRGTARDHWTPAVFLFVSLTVISALLLAALVFITLRRHRLPRRPSSISDKEELLPDPHEQSSLESLTIPDSPKLD